MLSPLQKRVGCILLVTVFFVFAGTLRAEKSVFIISKCGAPSKAQAYRIERDHVSYEDSVNIDTYNQGYGAVGHPLVACYRHTGDACPLAGHSDEMLGRDICGYQAESD
jgi:hypothetical protein